MKNFLTILFHRIRFSKSLLIGLLSCCVGLLTGAGVWLFKYLFNLIKQLSFTNFLNLFPNEKYWLVAFIPLLGGIAVGLLLHFFGKKEKVTGTAGIIQAVEIAGGRLRYQHLPVNTAAAVLSIGTGASVGPEDPSVQIGANIGSFFGQIFRLTETHTVTLVAAGAGAAIAAAFNAPIAGVFFALEIIIGDISGSALGMILVATVISSVFTQAVSGTQPAFHVLAYTMNSPWELIIYLGLGLLAGPISALYVRLLYWMQDFFHKWSLPRWVQTAIAGLCIGCVGIFLPQVFGVGYDTISAILSQQQLGFWLLVILMFSKLILTTFSIGGGFVGGVFAPSLFIGAALGGAYGIAMAAAFPSLSITPSAYALVGMAAVLAGSIHAPLTASILLFEMTGDYRIILPLMLSVAISLLVSQRIQPNSVYSMSLARKGFFINRGREIDVLDTVMVQETMTSNFMSLRNNDSLSTAKRKFAQTHDHGMPVFNTSGEFCGILTLGDLEKIKKEELSRKTVENVYQNLPVVTHPKESLSRALKKMSELSVGQLPVVLSDNPAHLVGILRREDIVQAYAIAVKRRMEQKHSTRRERLDAVTPEQVSIMEFHVHPKSAIVGKCLREISFPTGCVVASIRRKDRTLIPDGNSVVKSGDSLVLVADKEALEKAERLFHELE
jgi:CIC family chloride channel protein